MYTVQMDLYHALNRGVDKRTIFLDDQDRARFVHDLYEFNDSKPVKNAGRINKTNMSGLRDHSFTEKPGERLVDIHGWCLMGNHYHLLLNECTDNGLSLFLRKLNTGYANYFNIRYERIGTLFQGRTKKILIDSDAYFLHILNYIHLNPLDLTEGAKTWREREVSNSNDALDFLHSYRWSSYQDYAGTKNFPSILTTKFFQEVFEDQYTNQLQQYLKDIEINSIKSILLE